VNAKAKKGKTKSDELPDFPRGIGAPAPGGGPFNSTSPTGPFALDPPKATPDGAQIKEYHGKEPKLELLMNDPRLKGSKYYGDVARINSDWNLSAVKSVIFPTVNVPVALILCSVFFSLTSNTLWTTRGQDGGYLRRNGFLLTFCRSSQILLTFDPGWDFGGGGGDICGQTSIITFPKFPISTDVFDLMDNVVVTAKSDQFWPCS
jgi:hypothetical protein